MASQVYLWPNPALDGVVDEAGAPFPSVGAFVTWSNFYRSSVATGELLTKGPDMSGGVIPGPGVPPGNATYVVLSASSDLTAERVLTAGANITITDGGANGPVTIAGTPTGAPTDATYVVLSANAGLSNERALTAGANITITDGGANGPVTIAATVPPADTSTTVTNLSTHGPLLPTATTAATVTDALNNAWANNIESGVPFFIRVNGSATPTFSGNIGGQVVTGSVLGASRVGNYLQYRPRLLASSTAVAGTSAGVQYVNLVGPNQGSWFLENGLRITYRIGYEVLTPAMRSFAGIRGGSAAATTPGNIDPATFISCAGVGSNVGTGNLQLYHNDSVGAAVQQDLGANFPISLRATYEVTLVVPTPAAFTVAYSIMYYRVRRLDIKGAVAVGSWTSDLPPNSGSNMFTWSCSNNTDAAICTLAFLGAEGMQPF